METEAASVENTEASTFVTDAANENLENSISINNGEPEHNISDAEIRSIMETIAATGKFWHDWDILKGLLSRRLKQVWGEYAESQVVGDAGPQKCPLSGETYTDIKKRLDEALLCFMEGPPFTLQRLCEILLTPKSIYPNLSKLALALEKNLLVTSTISKCTDPYPPPPTLHGQSEPAEVNEEMPNNPSSPIENGVEPVEGDVDEEMVDAETNEEDTNMGAEKEEENPDKTSDDSITTSTSELPSELQTSSEQPSKTES
ncbi:hypothetical protein QJS10_CPA16g01481 [Acorus calamus]|uniref:Serine/threonine-protein phosphatase 4 regulatory subunit 2 n=1 Tax=Acorus calamus TaxID=4465 RepID=A0AAV9CYV6_ACOCL|nr:hypothetical protein QJS10_CPA16g01481 [Acorus calamus]